MTGSSSSGVTHRVATPSVLLSKSRIDTIGLCPIPSSARNQSARRSALKGGAASIPSSSSSHLKPGFSPGGESPQAPRALHIAIERPSAGTAEQDDGRGEEDGQRGRGAGTRAAVGAGAVVAGVVVPDRVHMRDGGALVVC